MDLELLLADVDRGTPVLEQGIPLATAATGARAPVAEAPGHRDQGADPSDLARQGWGVVLPKGKAGDHLWELIAPLRDARGGDVKRYDVPSGMGPEETAKWKDEVYADPELQNDEIPRYLLILGDADDISWDFQTYLAHEAFVGRIAFPDDAGYLAYVGKVLRAERKGVEAARTLFYTANDGSKAVAVGRASLVDPAVEAFEQRLTTGRFPASEIVTLPGGDGEALLREARKSDPTVLFSVSHGCGPPRAGWKSAADQRLRQGAMVVDDRGQPLTAADVAGRPFLPDGIWFFFACYGGGTPSRSAYELWMNDLHAQHKLGESGKAVLGALPKPGERPFMAALPRAALANPAGPLAVMAHVDLAWSFGFEHRAGPFESVVESLVMGRRVGPSFRELGSQLGAADQRLATMAQAEKDHPELAGDEARRVEKTELWMRRHDLANHVLLGDPAVRLSIPRFDLKPARPARTPEVASVPTPVPAPAPALLFAPAPGIPVAPAVSGLNGSARAALSDPAPAAKSLPAAQASLQFEPVPITISVLWASIDRIDETLAACVAAGVGAQPGPPVDAIAAGLYTGTMTHEGAVHALDVLVTAAMNKTAPPGSVPEGRDRILTAFARRRLLSGDLGRTFFLPDPSVGPGSTARVIALAGMGRPGTLRGAELHFLVRELCWSLGRMGKKHLASVLIGAGTGNLSLTEAVHAWMRGLRAAVTELEQDPSWHLERVTFVELDPCKVVEINAALETFRKIEDARSSAQLRLAVTFAPAPPGARTPGNAETLEQAARSPAKGGGPASPADPHGKPEPMRMMIERTGKRLRFGALTATASVPERNLDVDPTLIEEANARLPRYPERDMQVEWARYMGRLVFPEELAEQLKSPEPLVLMVDASTARIQWEMLVPPTPRLEEESHPAPLGLTRGVSRQLRTTFAPPPEPPPPPRRLLRVLIIADPADNLPHAVEEAKSLEALFKAFNEVHPSDDYRVEVKLLAGSRDACRNDVLFHLIACGPYDILHFAGHCAYDEQDPLAAGWVFKNGVLSVHELNRIDRVPRFVFANACESGVTPDRAHDQSLGLGPTFAEAFFNRGVANLVCTAWRVDDDAACAFALELYAGLLGLAVRRAEGHLTFAAVEKPLAMHEALLHARRRVRDGIHHATGDVAGMRTWGAYQHYGDPYLHLFDPDRFGATKSLDAADESASVPSAYASLPVPPARPATAPAPPAAVLPARAAAPDPPRPPPRIPEGGKTMISD
jgi:hypothetical protein